MKVYIPSPLRSYTQKRDEVEAQGATLADLLIDLNRIYPGLRFRIIDEQDGVREHIKIFVNREQAHDLRTTVRPNDEVSILCALSGG
jgi:molybdopterin synthase sulfur carrier subunit